MRKLIQKKVNPQNGWKLWWAWHPVMVHDRVTGEDYWVWGESVFRKWFWSRNDKGEMYWDRELGPRGFHRYQLPETFDCFEYEDDKRREAMKQMVEQAIEDMEQHRLSVRGEANA